MIAPDNPIQQPRSCEASACLHVQQYWPFWICTISAMGALIGKGYFNRWDVAGGFAATGTIVSLAISCFRRPAAPPTPAQIQHNREITLQNRDHLVDAAEAQASDNRQLADDVVALEEGHTITQQSLAIGRRVQEDLGALAAHETQDQQQLARVQHQQERIQGAIGALLERGAQGFRTLQQGNDRLSAVLQTHVQSRVHPGGS